MFGSKQHFVARQSVWTSEQYAGGAGVGAGVGAGIGTCVAGARVVVPWFQNHDARLPPSEKSSLGFPAGTCAIMTPPALSRTSCIAVSAGTCNAEALGKSSVAVSAGTRSAEALGAATDVLIGCCLVFGASSEACAASEGG
eukprot:CAMPEP_0172661620 /NCGR_PEP_ID=MMETSP1074-20121228/4817_1 /TAXON_ID=2916 /ORGANISM="Ceratium fusus, Strain PA161109" /LENGTH=140 /DNA_ID=CAMNT_0013477413 /DNA_START=1145 /DNA_END=1567 /DNA_ORIENTATION=-